MTQTSQTPCTSARCTAGRTLLALTVLMGVGIAFTGALAATLVAFAG